MLSALFNFVLACAIDVARDVRAYKENRDYQKSGKNGE